MTRGLEGRRSIQLSYGRTADPAEMIRLGRSGRSDSNRGLPAPKAGALTGLRHAPLPRASNYNRLLSVSQSPFCGSFVKASLTAWLSEEADLCEEDRKSTRLNSSHVDISYAVFCLKKKT